jgi:hypothetical protein
MKVPKKLLKAELFESGHPDIQVWQTAKEKL